MNASTPLHVPDSAERRIVSLRVLIGGILGMMVVMGIGRFVYTPILPLMQRDLGMTNSLAGWLASLNYVGYLAGAIACSLLPRLLRSPAVNAGVLAISLASTLLMGFTVNPLAWGVLRCAAGVASAVLFVIIAVEVSEALARNGCGRWVGSLYGGVGLGIAFSGMATPFLDRLGGWRAAWLGAGILACALAASGMILARKQNASLAIPATVSDADGDIRSIGYLAAAYFFEGLGYVISATFIVAMIGRTAGLESFAPYSWVAVGLAAAPSTIVWPLVARRTGVRPALVLAYCVQATGILVSINAQSIISAGFAAVSFGGTFLGIVALVMAEGTRRTGREGRRAAAILTACFGLGQVLGPPVAGIMADSYGSFTIPLVMAASSVFTGGAIILADRSFSRSFFGGTP